MSTPQLKAKEVFLALSDPNTLATPLHIILLSTYGEDIYDIDPVEIFLRLKEDFNVEKLDEDLENRVNAILLATSTTLFETDPEAFAGICQTLVNGDPGLDIVEPITLPEIMWGMYEVGLNRSLEGMSKAVERVINEAVENESGAVDDVANFDYVLEYLEEQRATLKRQLENLGCQNVDLPRVGQFAQNLVSGV